VSTKVSANIDTWELSLGEVTVDVQLKDIKNLHLSVHPPTGRVRLSAPTNTKKEAIRLFALSKLSWIKSQQSKLSEQTRETPREYLERESHLVWGKRYLLSFNETTNGLITLAHDKLILPIDADAPPEKKEALLEQWYRNEVRHKVSELVPSWEEKLGVSVVKIFVQRMKTKWGSCNSGAQTIRLNSELAKKPPTCLEYILVHEMMHIIEATHSENFKYLITRHMPDWPIRRDQLNQLPTRHEEWS